MYVLRSYSLCSVKTYLKTCSRLPCLFFTDQCTTRKSLHSQITDSIDASSLKLCILPNKYNTHSRYISTSSRLREKQDSPSVIQLIGESNVVHKVQDGLVNFHDFTGLSWWATVIIAAFTARTVFVLPLAIYQHYVTAKLEMVYNALNTTERENVTKKIHELSDKNNWDSKTMSKEYKKMIHRRKNELILEHNCHPAKTTIIVLFQAPVWITLSSALRNLIYMLPVQDAHAQIIYLQLKASSFLWLSDLTLPDQTWTIPVMLALVNLSNIQLNYSAKKQQNKGMGKFVLYVARGVILGVAYVSSTVPSIISLYWLTSGCYGLIQNIILLNPNVRQFLGIPFTKNTHKQPLSRIAKRIKGFFYFFKY